MMRALAMDFVSDKKTHHIDDQFLFGSSIMVAPVTDPMYVREVIQRGDTLMVEDFSRVQSDSVYLPAGTEWYDFWTGEKLAGGKSIEKQTPLDIIPVYVKAGSVIPFGPPVQYAQEKAWDNLEIRIYAGADGTFVLYEDEFDTYNYEKDMYATIGFVWDDAAQKLTIEERKGSFPGMLENRTFSIVKISGDKTRAYPPVEYDHVVTYTGEKIEIEF